MAAMAVAVGVRAASCTTEVPSLMVEVWPAIQPSGVKASDPHASAVHTESKPEPLGLLGDLDDARGGSCPQ